MLLNVNIEEKSIGHAHLLDGLKFTIAENEKVGLIGRNGVGKTTLFRILGGLDKDYTGEIIAKKGLKIIATKQEFHSIDNITCLE